MNDDSREIWDFGARLAFQLREMERRVTFLAHAVAWCGIVVIVLAVVALLHL